MTYRAKVPFPRKASNATTFVACWIARNINADTTVDLLRREFGMSRATAYRWLRAWKDVNHVERQELRGRELRAVA